MSFGSGYVAAETREMINRGYITDTTTGAYREAIEYINLDSGAIRYTDTSNPTVVDTVAATEDFDEEVIRVPLSPSESLVTSQTAASLAAIPANSRFAVVHVWGDAVSYTIDGATVPDFAGNGERVANGGKIILDNADDISNFSVVSESATGGSVFVKFYNRAPGASRGGN